MEYLSVALSKGRLAEITFDRFQKMGVTFVEYSPKSRKLIFMNEKYNIKVVLVKSGDVTTYVEQGACDIGIVGKDNLLEKKADIYEIMDLGFGKCKFVVAALKKRIPVEHRTIRVATKYPNVAQDYFYKKGEGVEIIYLSGSVELAPIMGLSDVIVDIVETGTTLRENGLQVIEDICPISARLIANRVSFKAKSSRIQKLMKGLQTK
ncbi:ATP phosphoribosyltransferase [Garciella nitratireducens]|uniref:ATP phosphoribosyltransferase n=1 Tax=Garciella nitratireducens DSM 15102 TaxID=1121911 RepID=A0A1T4KNI1_9FIRM|nr:ATP phosphoribosyltransferase [Garciella nitratireducens]RBP40280.1 ATP phosphoribosyltransferase [Garciella nitratireducens]SJZ43928.1 ATP phosphoribosyltransferase [Garciella nitratireducens DSM 15102]